MAIKQTKLEYRDGSSDKVYIAEIWAAPHGQYRVMCQYGRRGSTLRETDKGTFADLYLAEQAYNKVLDSKKAKGYRFVESVENDEPVAKSAPKEELVSDTVLTSDEDSRSKALARLKAASVW